MKKIEKRLFCFLAVVAGFMLFLAVPGNASAAIKATYSVDDTATCMVTNTSGVKVKWKVSNKRIKVIKKNNYGLKFRADTPGSVKVTAKVKVTGQTLTWKITIKKKTVDMGELEVCTDTANTLVIDNGLEETVSWKTSNDNLNVISSDDSGFSFKAVDTGTTNVTAITKRYKYVWVVIAVGDSAVPASGGAISGTGTNFEDISGFVSDMGMTELSEDDLKHIAEVVVMYLVTSPYSSSLTEKRVTNFCTDVMIHLLVSGRMMSDDELVAYMDSVVDYLYTDREFRLFS